MSLAALGCALLSLLANGRSATAQSRGDFNGDGFDDLAVGVPSEMIATADRAGAVNVLYGAATGLSASIDQFWGQNSGTVGDVSEHDDSLGHSMASGDFDGDGFDDLAIGAPFEDIGTANSAGGVNVLYGSGAGLTEARNQFWAQDTERIPDDPEEGDLFGWALTSGDFNADGFDDLAVGIPLEDVGSIFDAGAVLVLYGSDIGLSVVNIEVWHQDISFVLDQCESQDAFGRALTSGDFNGDGFDDLAVGVGTETIGSAAGAGAVSVLYGTPGGLTTAGDQFWHQDAGTIAGMAERSDQFGSVLAAGDFNRDGFDDLAIGVPSEDIGLIENAGGVNVIFGSAAGLTDVGNQFWAQDAPGVAGDPEAGDLFGGSLAADDFTGDGFDDLIIGIAGEDSFTGAIQAMRGSATGLRPVRFVAAKVEGGAMAGDGFGSALGAGDFNRDGIADLAVGVPSDDVGTIVDAGSISVFAGRNAFLRQFWHQDSPSVEGTAEVGDRFGGQLSRR